MMHSLALFALAFAATTTATILPRQLPSCVAHPNSNACAEDETNYLEAVCNPLNSTGSPDLNAPCNAAAVLTDECIYGADRLNLLSGNESQNDAPMLSNATQRLCTCESQYFNEFQGCNDCYKAHGAEDAGLGLYVDPKILSSISASYCAVTNTPTLGLADMLYAFATGSYASSLASVQNTASQTSIFSDPVGNNTAVSIYFTPSVPASSAWIAAQASITPSNSTVTTGGGSSSGRSTSSASMLTSNGEIVPTAAAATSGSAAGAASGTASGASGSPSSTGSSGAGTQEAAAVAGVIALAGFVVLF